MKGWAPPKAKLLDSWGSGVELPYPKDLTHSLQQLQL